MWEKYMVHCIATILSKDRWFNHIHPKTTLIEKYVRNCLKIRLLLVGVFQPYVVLQMYLGIQSHKSISNPVQYLITSISTHGSPSSSTPHLILNTVTIIRHLRISAERGNKHTNDTFHASLKLHDTCSWLSEPRHNENQSNRTTDDTYRRFQRFCPYAKFCHVLRTSKVHRSLNTSSNHLISSPRHFL